MSESELLSRYTLLAYAAANPFYVNGMDRDDLDQEALTAALTAIRTFDPAAGTLAGHIHLSVRRRMITLLKHQKREKRDAVVFSLREDDWVEDALHVHVEDRERLAAALELIRQMTARQARALIGVAIGLTYREIDTNPKSVDNALALARAKLAAIPA